MFARPRLMAEGLHGVNPGKEREQCAQRDDSLLVMCARLWPCRTRAGQRQRGPAAGPASRERNFD